MAKCEDLYSQVQDHQYKGGDISIYTFEKQLQKCRDFKSEDSLQFLKCYNYKLNKLGSRFDNYYFKQRMNLIDRLNKNIK